MSLFSWLNSSRNQRKNSWSSYLQRQPGWNQRNGTWWGICKKDCHWNVGWISRIWCQWMFHTWQPFFLYRFCYSYNKLWPSFVGIPFLKPVLVVLIFTLVKSTKLMYHVIFEELKLMLNIEIVVEFWIFVFSFRLIHITTLTASTYYEFSHCGSKKWYCHFFRC